MNIFVSAKPNSKNEEVLKIDETHFMVKVKEPPVEGRANQAIISALADYFKTSASKIKIKSGFTSKQKIIEVLF
ncbi:DUF167 domain-containing protein [Candidatus Wolfebacteria bacterium]|nr:DUF167 domain-containing protein [Candidatus Wolfebacteria bacterium]